MGVCIINELMMDLFSRHLQNAYLSTVFKKNLQPGGGQPPPAPSPSWLCHLIQPPNTEILDPPLKANKIHCNLEERFLQT